MKQVTSTPKPKATTISLPGDLTKTLGPQAVPSSAATASTTQLGTIAQELRRSSGQGLFSDEEDDAPTTYAPTK